MLIGTSHRLAPDQLHALASMRHGDEIVLADANLPSAAIGRQAFQQRTGQAFAVVAGGELRTYGNIILKKGVIAA